MASANKSADILGGLLLLAATIAALLMANTALAPVYDQFLSTRIDFRIAPQGDIPKFEIAKPMALWINDGLMAIFFFLVGMEIKREVMVGHLSNPRIAILPVFAALGGVLVPVLIFWLIAGSNPLAMRGWAIPMATDIAFAIAVAIALGKAVPLPLKVFLLALAIIDDLMAIIAIAIFYTSQLSFVSMALGLTGVAALAALNFAGVRKFAPYLIIGIFTWACVLKSGVHATLAGVALGLAIPLLRDSDGSSPLESAEHGLKPWITFGVMPIFAFANAGVNLSGVTLDKLFEALPLGIIAGLFIGKQIGVFTFSWLAVKSGLAAMPKGVNWLQLYGVSILTGIGFTMSLFIGSLAFDDPARIGEVRLGVLAGSLLSTVMAVAVLIIAGRRQTQPEPEWSPFEKEG